MEEKNYENELVTTETEDTELNVWNSEDNGDEYISAGSPAGKYVGLGFILGAAATLVGTKVVPWASRKLKAIKDKRAGIKAAAKYKADKEAAKSRDSVVVDEELEYFESTEQSEG